MIKIEIHILEGQLDIEIKKNLDQYFLLVILSQSTYFKEKSRAWNGKTMDEPKVQEIAHFIKECHQNPSIPKGITINDGMMVKITLKDDISAILLTIKDDFDEADIEFQLIQKVFDFVHEIIDDVTLKKYMLAFGGLF